MGGFSSWIESNWSSVVGAAGIIGSLWFTAASFREDSKAKQMANILALVERQRVLWSDANQRQDLQRIFLDNANLYSQPITVAESEFLDLIVLHFETGWRIEQSMDKRNMKGLALDAGEFFSLPLPHGVWEKTKKFRNPHFVQFVEAAIEHTTKSRSGFPQGI